SAARVPSSAAVPAYQRQAAQLAPGVDVGAAAEHVIIVRLDVVQNGAVKFTGSSDGQTPVPVQERNARPCFGIQAAVARYLKAHTGAPALIDPSGGNILFCERIGIKFVQRQVQASRSPVFTHVAQNVGQLKRHPQLDCIGD